MSTDVDSVIDFKLKGGAAASHLLFGGTPADGLVFGAGFFTLSATDPEVEFDGGSYDTKDVTLTLGQLALFGDWFPDPNGGFHLGLGVGPAVVTAEVDGNTSSSDDASSSGLAGTLFLGYDFWVGEEWSIGGMATFTGASTKNTDNGADEQLDTRAFSIQFTALYH